MFNGDMLLLNVDKIECFDKQAVVFAKFGMNKK